MVPQLGNLGKSARLRIVASHRYNIPRTNLAGVDIACASLTAPLRDTELASAHWLATVLVAIQRSLSHPNRPNYCLSLTELTLSQRDLQDGAEMDECGTWRPTA